MGGTMIKQLGNGDRHIPGEKLGDLHNENES